ncbi:MAG: hypothetical protein R6U97_09925 [Desulfosalsimonas sp.]
MNDQNHGNDHSHLQEVHDHGTKEMLVSEKFKKMITHWIKHNDYHAATYRQCARRAAEKP